MYYASNGDIAVFHAHGRIAGTALVRIIERGRNSYRRKGQIYVWRV